MRPRSSVRASSHRLAAERVSKRFGGDVVLRDVSLAVNPGSRVGVVGRNGIGKSTLLRLLAGLERPDAGRVIRSPGLEVGYLAQEPDARANERLRDYLARRAGVASARRELDAALAAMDERLDRIARHGEALDRWMTLGGEDFEARAAETCADLGLAGKLNVRVAELSGGEAARAGLCAVLLARFDVFLLDEPTNDLDFDGLARLEGFLALLNGGVVVTSHDRVFLERAVDHVVEIEEGTHRASHYAGGFGWFLGARAERRRRAAEANARTSAERERLLARARQHRAWGDAGARRARRAAPDGDKHVRAARAAGAESAAARARALERRVARLEEVEKPWEPWRLELSFAPGARAGDVVAGLYGAVVRRDSFVLGPIDVEIEWGERVAVTGPNGSGKTTLLSALTGDLPLMSGRRVVGPSTRLGRLDQARARFSRSEDMLRLFCTETGVLEEEARTLLAKFDLGATDVLRAADSLSPGERTRAALAALMATGVNLLVLDEPTNHLDLEAIEQLESALRSFAGTSVLVTHDRRLLECFEPSRTITMPFRRARLPDGDPARHP